MSISLYFGLAAIAAAFVMYRFLIRPSLEKEARETLIARLKADAPPAPVDACRVVARAGRRIRYGCGHVDARRFAHDFYGEVCDADLAAIKRFDLCGDCLLAAALATSCRCAVCGYVILAGEGVAIVRSDPSMPEAWRTPVGEGGAVACLRMDCCPTAAFFAGHWTDRGYLPRASGMSVAGEAFATGAAVAGSVGPISGHGV